MSGLEKLIHEMHRRSLWQVLSIYVVGAWVALQVVDVLVDNFGLPEWFPALALALLVIGLPIVLATAFVQEGGPVRSEGRRASDESMLEEGEPHPLDERTLEPDPASGDPDGGLDELFTWKNAIAGGVLAFAVWGVVATGWILLGERPAMGSGNGDSARASIAVLPFENLSGDEETRPFTDGVHDDLLTQLAKIGSLKVISRTSVQEYRGTTKSVSEIADELDVAAILEGGVQRSGDRIRVNAQLIAGREDEHLWAETFDRRLTAENVFEIQSELARRIAEALRAELTPEEEARIAERPTDDMEAYDFYVRGNEYYRRSYDEEDQELAVRMFERAVAEDSTFTEAWAALSIAHSFIYLLGQDRTDERLQRSREAVDRALALEPENPHARIALGLYHYRGHQAYERALAQYERAAEDLPGDAYVHGVMAAAHRRAGNWERALDHFSRSAELDPRSAVAHYEVGGTYHLMRRYEEAIPYLERSTALSPEWTNGYGWLAVARTLESGTLDAGRAVLEEYPDEEGLEGTLLWQSIYEGEYEEALGYARSEEELAEAQFGVFPREFATGVVRMLMGRDEEGRADFRSVVRTLEERLERTPDDPRVHTVLGEAHAWLGQEEPAVRHGRRAVELYPVEDDALEGPTFLATLARIHALLGHEDEALDLLDRILSIPGRLEPVNLRYYPAWDSVRDHPRFQTLLEPWF